MIAFDTEFVSEDRYRPELCLIQVATESQRAVIDPLAVGDTTRFWEILASTPHTVVAHAAREEIRYCLRFSGRCVSNLFDVQLAAGFIGMEYPASLSTLVARFLGENLSKGETRTDWRRRPLSSHQLDYAIQDVEYLPELYRRIRTEVERLDRLNWLEEETRVFQESIQEAETTESWRRISGASGLSPRQMAIVRSLWRWREQLALDTDQPARRILRDDLMVELARRGTDDVRRIRAIRGLERRHLQAQMENIAEAIRAGMEVADHDLPKRWFGSRKNHSPVLTQFLSTAIGSVCREHLIAPAIVGNTDDVRDLLTYELEGYPQEPPALLCGWRAEVIGRSFRDLLKGKLALRVADLDADQPLEFVRVDAK